MIDPMNNDIKTNSQVILLCGGADMCGKTNILRALSDATGIPYFKASGEHENFLNSQDKFLNELRYSDPRAIDIFRQTGQSILMDRGYMCEWVYSRYFGRQTDDEMLRRIDEAYASLGAKVLICTRRSFAGIKDDLDARIDSAALEKISDLYKQFCEWTKCDVHVLYVDSEDIVEEVTEVLSFMGYDAALINFALCNLHAPRHHSRIISVLPTPTVTVQYVGAIDDDVMSEPGVTSDLSADEIRRRLDQRHAVLYTDGYITLTTYEHCYACWYADGTFMGGSMWNIRWRLSRDSCEMIQALRMSNKRC